LADGLVDEDDGMGGKESRSDAPNELVGLNALRPVNPVVCALRGGEPAPALILVLFKDVTPVDWFDSIEDVPPKSELVVAVVEVVGVEEVRDDPVPNAGKAAEVAAFCSSGFGVPPNAPEPMNDDAMLEIPCDGARTPVG
jgi:hypothetical protein